jgi:hypothetical protein
MVPGINQKPPVYVVPVGDTLLDTLLLNWPFPHLPRDKPHWCVQLVAVSSDPVGVQEGFTWLPRSVWIRRE